MQNSRPRGLRQHQAGDGLSRGGMGRVRGRSRSLLGHDGGPGRAGSFEVKIALSSAKLPSRAPAFSSARDRSARDIFDVHHVDEQLRAGQHRIQRHASWNRQHAASFGWKRARMGPISRAVSSAATRETVQAVGR